MTVTIDPGALADHIQVVIDEYIRDNADAITDRLASRAPRGKTGALAASHFHRRPNRRTFEIVAGNEDIDYAASVHQGHGVIRPIAPGGYKLATGKRAPRAAAPPAGFLKFEIGGRTVFAREVGPQPGRPWMTQGLRELGMKVSDL
jgi:hypothetical protein